MAAKKILWHDSYASGYKNVMSSDEAFEKYQNSIIKFATHYDYDTVSLTALGSEISGGFLPPSDLPISDPNYRTEYYYINKFIAAAETAGLSVALNVFQKNGATDTVDQLVVDLQKNIIATKNLTFGIDKEVNSLTAKTYETEKDTWITALNKHFGEGNYDDFLILGGLAQPKTWTPSENFKNAYEYYSEDGDSGPFNKTISGNQPAYEYNKQQKKWIKEKNILNDPTGALEYIQNVIEFGEKVGDKTFYIDGPIDEITGEYNGQVPIFSIGTGNANNTLGKPTNGEPIGPAIFGTWEPAEFNAFLTTWNNAYPDTTDILVYHGDQLPTAWYENL